MTDQPYGDDAFLNELAAILAELKAITPGYEALRWMMLGENRAILQDTETGRFRLIQAHENVLHKLARGRGYE